MDKGGRGGRDNKEGGREGGKTSVQEEVRESVGRGGSDNKEGGISNGRRKEEYKHWQTHVVWYVGNNH